MHVITQLPVEQLAVPCALVHGAPHVPQLVEVLSWTSQPFDATPSQSPQPASHDDILQAPAVHVDVAFGSEHCLPHVPQLDALVSRLTSQPLPPSPSQLPNPVLQVSVHVPVLHTAVPFTGLHC